MGSQWLFGRSGPLTVGAGQVGGAACSPHAIGGRPDLQFNVMPLSVDKPGTPLHRYSGFTAAVWQCHPESRGRVAIASRDPFAAPALKRAISKPSAIVGRSSPASACSARSMRSPRSAISSMPKFCRGASAQSDAQLLDFAREQGGTVFHCVGTCRMGTDALAVVDPTLRVRGVEGLRVIDASVMPTVTSANTNAASLMIGEHGVRLLLAQRARSGSGTGLLAQRTVDPNIDGSRSALPSVAVRDSGKMSRLPMNLQGGLVHVHLVEEEQLGILLAAMGAVDEAAGLLFQHDRALLGKSAASASPLPFAARIVATTVSTFAMGICLSFPNEEFPVRGCREVKARPAR